MANTETKPAGLKAKLTHEIAEYLVNVVWLTLVFASFTVYRRLVLAEYHIAYTHYWVALVEGLILGKVIMIGSIFRLGLGLEGKPLIFPTLYKTVVFTVFCAAFKVVEHGVRGLFTGPGFRGGIDLLLAGDSYEMGANSLMVFFAFVPFFAVKELGRVLGDNTIGRLFFGRRSVG